MAEGDAKDSELQDVVEGEREWWNDTCLGDEDDDYFCYDDGDEDDDDEDGNDEEDIKDGECGNVSDFDIMIGDASEIDLSKERPSYDASDLDIMASDASEIQLNKEHSSYDALAEKKRKQQMDQPAGQSSKSARLDNECRDCYDQIMDTVKIHKRRGRKSRELKKKGRKKGSRNKVSPEITRMLGDATLHYASDRHEEAIPLFTEVIRLAPNLPGPYHTLGLIYKSRGDSERAFNCYLLASQQMPKDASIWKQLLSLSMDLGEINTAIGCLNKAMKKDPENVALKYRCASLLINEGENEKASKIYDDILKLCPDDADAHKKAANLHETCGRIEQSIGIMERFLKEHESSADFLFVDHLVSMCMQCKEYDRALQHIEKARLIYFSKKEFPLFLTTKAGVCHVYLGNINEAEARFRVFHANNAKDHPGFVCQVAHSYMSIGRYDFALKYYLMLDNDTGDHIGDVHLKLAQCYKSLNETVQAINYLYKALGSLEHNIDARLTLASLLLQEDKKDEAISLLSPPANSETMADISSALSPPANLETMAGTSSVHSKSWWLNGKVKLQLAKIYQSRKMYREFADIVFPLVTETLFIEKMNQKYRPKKKLPDRVLFERTKALGARQAGNIIFPIRPPATVSLSKATRAQRDLQKRGAQKAEKKAAASAAGIEWNSDNSDEDSQRQEPKEPPLPDLLKDQQLIVDLCRALASLEKYWEVLEVVNLSLKLANNKLSTEIKEELQCLGAEVEHNITDPRHGYEYICRIIQQRPDSVAAWNRFYKATSKQSSRHAKFLRSMRAKHEDCVPPMIIAGNYHTFDDRYQAAAASYLQAYKVLPENPLVNLCAGSALVNLACQFRLRNKHQCLAQGLAFLYNNQKHCRNSQESLYNIARAYHHIGLVSLAVTYYEKVLITPESDYPIPNLPYDGSNPTENLEPGYCNLRREAAYNLHLIYKSSGAVDLARQILKDHCSF